MDGCTHTRARIANALNALIEWGRERETKVLRRRRHKVSIERGSNDIPLLARVDLSHHAPLLEIMRRHRESVDRERRFSKIVVDRRGISCKLHSSS